MLGKQKSPEEMRHEAERLCYQVAGCTLLVLAFILGTYGFGLIGLEKASRAWVLAGSTFGILAAICFWLAAKANRMEKRAKGFQILPNIKKLELEASMPAFTLEAADTFQVDRRG